MSELDLAGRLEDLFRETGEAHQAYIETEAPTRGPLWYAGYLQERLGRSWRPASPGASSSTS